MILTQTDQILDKGYDSSPQAIVDQESSGEIGLTWNFQTSFMNSLHIVLIFSISMGIWFFEFCWIKPNQSTETKIYV